MERLSCTYCMGSRAMLIRTGGIKPMSPDERLAPTPITCPRCVSPSYCSMECGQLAAQMHATLCFDAAASDGAAIAAADAAIAAVTEENDAAEFARIAEREKVLFLELWKVADVEARSFPHIFMMGGGHFGGLLGRDRFRNYRNFRMHHISTAHFWADGGVWLSWAAATQGMINLALRNERLGRPRGWDLSKNFPHDGFAAFRATLVPRPAAAAQSAAQ